MMPFPSGLARVRLIPALSQAAVKELREAGLKLRSMPSSTPSSSSSSSVVSALVAGPGARLVGLFKGAHGGAARQLLGAEFLTTFVPLDFRPALGALVDRAFPPPQASAFLTSSSSSFSFSSSLSFSESRPAGEVPSGSKRAQQAMRAAKPPARPQQPASSASALGALGAKLHPPAKTPCKAPPRRPLQSTSSSSSSSSSADTADTAAATAAAAATRMRSLEEASFSPLAPPSEDPHDRRRREAARRLAAGRGALPPGTTEPAAWTCAICCEGPEDGGGGGGGGVRGGDGARAKDGSAADEAAEDAAVDGAVAALAPSRQPLVAPCGHLACRGCWAKWRASRANLAQCSALSGHGSGHGSHGGGAPSMLCPSCRAPIAAGALRRLLLAE